MKSSIDVSYLLARRRTEGDSPSREKSRDYIEVEDLRVLLGLRETFGSHRASYSDGKIYLHYGREAENISHISREEATVRIINSRDFRRASWVEEGVSEDPSFPGVLFATTSCEFLDLDVDYVEQR